MTGYVCKCGRSYWDSPVCPTCQIADEAGLTDGVYTTESAPVDVYVTASHPHYQVWADGQIVEMLTIRTGEPLTDSDQVDVADNYRRVIESGLFTPQAVVTR